jgi:hypothetical protein
MLHLQQTIPRVKFTSQVTTPAKSAVRQQPRGLKMRFRPIGFDTETTGSGLSDVESASDQEMPDVQIAEFRKAVSLSPSVDGSEAEKAILPSKAGVKSKPPSAGSSKAASGSTKRKHSEGDAKKSKHSSSKPANITGDRKLKRFKPQVENQKTTASESASTEARYIASAILPPKPPTSTYIPHPLPIATTSKSVIVPPSASIASTTQTSLPASLQGSPLERPTFSKSTRTAISTGLSQLDRQIQVIDPNLTANERKKEIKRLKKTGDSDTLKTKPEGWTQISTNIAVETKNKTPVPLPPLSSHASSDQQVHSRDKNSEKKKKKRGIKETANGVQEKTDATEKISLPRSTAPILPPKYGSKR